MTSGKYNDVLEISVEGFNRTNDQMRNKSCDPEAAYLAVIAGTLIDIAISLRDANDLRRDSKPVH